MNIRLLMRCVLVLPLAGFSTAINAADCGCDRAATGCQTCSTCRTHRCRLHQSCNCCNGRTAEAPRSAPPRFAEVPSGPIVESYPVMRAAPTMMVMPFMPMMMGAQTRSVALDVPRAAPPEPTCASSKDRLDDLDQRVEALNLRLKTIQRAVELQTTILQELKAQASGGSRPAISNGG